MWLEVLILPSYNDSKQDLTALKEAIIKINPTSVQLNTLDRPGTIKNIRGCTRSELQKIKDFLDLDIIEIISPKATRKNINQYKGDIETSILETLERRPCTIDDFVRILGPQVSQINKYLDILVEDGKIYTEEEERGTFYQLTSKLQE